MCPRPFAPARLRQLGSLLRPHGIARRWSAYPGCDVRCFMAATSLCPWLTFGLSWRYRKGLSLGGGRMTLKAPYLERKFRLKTPKSLVVRVANHSAAFRAATAAYCTDPYGGVAGVGG